MEKGQIEVLGNWLRERGDDGLAPDVDFLGGAGCGVVARPEGEHGAWLCHKDENRAFLVRSLAELHGGQLASSAHWGKLAASSSRCRGRCDRLTGGLKAAYLPCDIIVTLLSGHIHASARHMYVRSLPGCGGEAPNSAGRCNQQRR